MAFMGHMTLVHHNLVAQAHAAHLLARAGIGKGLDNEVILLGDNHEAHALLPVAKAVELEVVAHEVVGRLHGVDGHGVALHRYHGGFLGVLGLDDIGIPARVFVLRHCHQEST